MKIVFEKPYLEKNGNNTRVCCRITGMEAQPFVLWYEVDNEYADCLCTERSDAFLVGLLPHLMARSSTDAPTVVELVQPLSERIYYQINQTILPSLVPVSKGMYKPIELVCEVDGTVLPSAGAVGTGISGGVDSFYTLLTNRDSKATRYNLTHGVYCDMALYGPVGGEAEQKRWKFTQDICDDNGIRAVKITSNLCCDLYKVGHDAVITFMIMSNVLALQKLFSAYCISSGFSFEEFTLDVHSCPQYDLLSVYAFRNENVDFFTAGGAVPRIEKVKLIARCGHKAVHDYLNVCVKPLENQKNCSRCSKCTRTMLELYANGDLEQYADVFDVAYFKKNPNYYFGYMYMKGKKDHFMHEIFTTMKKNGLKIPFGARWIGFCKLAKNGFHRTNPLATEYRP